MKTLGVIKEIDSAANHLVFLGVQDYYETYEAIAQPDSPFYIKDFNQYDEAYDWLHQLKHPETPSAVICSYEFLAQDGFRFLRECKATTLLNEVAFFLLKPEEIKVDPSVLLKLGINDCFSTPIDWQFLRERINFHYKLKNLPFKKESSISLKFFQINTLKRIFDILFSLILLVLISPLLLLIAAAIKLESKGPIIYCSKRAGRNYHVFDFYKFRSMYQDADQRLKDLKHLNQYKDEEENCFIKIKNDPRITKVGRLIRKTSLDELPQLFNVLKGDMSVVGNRPLPLYEARQLTKNEWVYRFLAPAGLTGLWQVTKRGKNQMSTEERVQLDVHYAKNRSLWYDFKILFQTLPAMVQHEDV